MLASSHLIGFGATDDASAPDAVITFRANSESASDLTTYTFAGLSLGPASADRYIIVAVGTDASPKRTFSSVTVAGVTATSIVTQQAASFITVGIFIVAVPTGTTGDVVVTLSGASARCAVGVWSATGLLSPAATDTDTSTSSTASVSLDVSAGGIAVGFSNTYTSGSARTFSWTGLTEFYDVAYDGNNDSISGASGNYAAAQSPLAITSTPSAATTDHAHVFASFR